MGTVGGNGKGDGFNVKTSLRAKRRCQLIVRLKTIECYKGLPCYLSSSTSGLFLIAVTTSVIAILLAFQEVERRKHSPWNSSTLWGWCTKQVRGTLLPSDTLRLSCLLSGVPNRSGGLFYFLTLLLFNSKQSTKQVKKDYSTFQHFYSFACYAKHRTSQEKLFWHFTVELLHLAPSDNHRHGLITPLDWGLIYMPHCLICDLHGGIHSKTFQGRGGLPTGGWSCQDDFVRLELYGWGW